MKHNMVIRSMEYKNMILCVLEIASGG